MGDEFVGSDEEEEEESDDDDNDDNSDEDGSDNDEVPVVLTYSSIILAIPHGKTK